MEIRNGSCGCGSLKYQLKVTQLTLYSAIVKNAKNYGSDKWFGTWIPKSNFKIIEGSPLIYSRLGDSGKDLNLLFCR